MSAKANTLSIKEQKAGESEIVLKRKRNRISQKTIWKVGKNNCNRKVFGWPREALIRR